MNCDKNKELNNHLPLIFASVFATIAWAIISILTNVSLSVFLLGWITILLLVITLSKRMPLDN